MSQLAFPFTGGGANRPSLVEAQQEFARIGVSEARLQSHARPPNRKDRRDSGWRPIIADQDRFLDRDSAEDMRRWRELPYPTPLYYWRDDYWLSRKSRNA